MFNLIYDEKIKSFSNNLFGNINVLVLNNKPYFPADHINILLMNDTSITKSVCILEEPHVVEHNMWYQIGVRAFNEPMVEQIPTFFVDGENVRRLISHSESDKKEELEKLVFEEIVPAFNKKNSISK